MCVPCGSVLLGLLANTLLGLWWADPVAGPAVAAVKEGVDAWRGDNCCEVPGLDPLAGEDLCTGGAAARMPAVRAKRSRAEPISSLPTGGTLGCL
jgi:hypothetical protein